ncbi:MAG: hypothetical protein EU541_08380 [Promethearchaeota archaeon]|nr:MAG: hypothetical protein EU541_08380 [Candidatus Lokiarchaeota archaeon]
MLNLILFHIFLILNAIFIIIVFVVGIFLLIRGLQIKMTNIIIASIGFIGLPIGFIGYFVFNLSEVFQETFVYLAYLSTVIFTNLTFYKKKEREWINYTNIVLFSVIILGLIQILLLYIQIYLGIYVYYFRVALDFLYTFLTFFWLAWAAFQSYQRLKEYKIAPWIKLRYRLLWIFSLIISFNNVPEFFQPPGVQWGTSNNLISLIVFGTTAILGVIFAIGFLLAWIMPNWLKVKVKGDYTPSQDIQYSEEELMRLIKEQLNN